MATFDHPTNPPIPGPRHPACGLDHLDRAIPGPRHPAWCDSLHCERTETDIRHSSAPVRWETCDARFTLTLLRSDELAFPETWGGAPELRLEVDCRTLVGEPVTVHLPMPELRGTVARLAEQLRRGELGAAELAGVA